MIRATVDDLFNQEVLDKAIKKVEHKKTICGFDGIYSKDVRHMWQTNGDEIETKIRKASYHPFIADSFEIKKKNGKKRNITVPAATDKVILTALNLVLQPQYEELFSNRSFAFRPRKGTMGAIRYLRNKMNAGYDCIIKTDIKSCYDAIDHKKLLAILERDISDKFLYTLLERYINMKYCKYNRVLKMNIGIMQGSALSPLLANIYLNEFDQMMEKNGFQFVRYADDIVILGKNKKEVQRAFVAAKAIMDRDLHLQFNDEKTTLSLRKGIDFLGYHIGKRSRYGCYKFFISEDAKNDLLEHALIANNKCDTPENHLAWLGSFNRGWLNYYKYTDKKELKRIALSIDEYQKQFFLSHWSSRASYTIKQLHIIKNTIYEFISMHDWLYEVMGRLTIIRK